jgi:hypothetical protein
MKRSTVIAMAGLTMALMIGETAFAGGCRSNGRVYPVGAVVGSLVCTVNGWSLRGR